MKLMELIRGEAFTKPDIQNKKLFDFETKEAFIAYYHHASREGIRRFARLHRETVMTLGMIPGERREFFISGLMVHMEIMLGLYGWVFFLSCAARDRMGERNDQAFKRDIDGAVYALAKLYADRQKALTGKWEHWYDGDRLMDISGALAETKGLYHYCGSFPWEAGEKG